MAKQRAPDWRDGEVTIHWRADGTAEAVVSDGLPAPQLTKDGLIARYRGGYSIKLGQIGSPAKPICQATVGGRHYGASDTNITTADGRIVCGICHPAGDDQWPTSSPSDTKSEPTPTSGTTSGAGSA